MTVTSVSCLAKKINSPCKSWPDGGRLKTNLLPSLPFSPVEFLSGSAVEVGGSTVVVGSEVCGPEHRLMYNVIQKNMKSIINYLLD